jgi:hypothetical protein
MPDLKAQVMEFLSTTLSDFEFIVDNHQRLINRPGNKIGNVWTKVRENIVSVTNQIDKMTVEQLTDKLSEVSFSVAQIEWEIEECRVIGIPFHAVSEQFRKGELIENPPRDLFNKGLRPLLRWLNITLGSLSYAFPLLGAVKEFDKVIAQKINE